MPTTPPPPPSSPPLKAAALAYERESDEAPRLTARSRGAVADKILEIARAHNVPIRSDVDLVEILEKVEIGSEIPLEVYAVVAEIFAYIYKVNQSKAAR